MNSFMRCFFQILLSCIFFIIVIAIIPNHTTYADELKKGTISCDLLNNRELPDANSKVIFKVAQNARVNVIGTYEEWVKIAYKEYTGWTKKEYINIDSSVVELPKAEPKIGYINTDSVNLRYEANSNSPIYEKLVINQEIIIYEELNGWTRCKKGETLGWIKTEFVSLGKPKITTTYTQKKIGYIVGSNINIRKLADVSSTILTKLNNNTKVNILALSGNWYNVQINDIKGWVNKDFIKILTQKEQDALIASQKQQSSVTSKPIAPDQPIVNSSTNNGNVNADQLIAYAKKFLGTRYVYGGSSPSGFDCSGFVCYVYNNFGIGLNRSSASMASNGVSVAKSNLKPGDLVFFDTNMRGVISHVGIYIGNGQFIQSASGRAMKVIISSMNEASYARQYVTARRVIN